MSEAWYYANGSNRVGPLSRADLVQALSLMPEPAKTLVWRNGFSDWRKVSELSELSLYVAKPPPLPTRLPSILEDSVGRVQGDLSEHQTGGVNILSALFSFRGRLNRTQFALVYIIAYLLPLVLFVAIESEGSYEANGYTTGFLIVLLVWMLWVHFASLTKRLHDTEKSGAYCLLLLVPVVGLVFFLFVFFAPGTPTANRYGPPP